jgi:plastocyanin
MEPGMTEAMESMEPISEYTEETSAPTDVSATSAPITSGNAFEVEISDFAFDVNSITIKVGDTITWTNHDSSRHSVVADDGSFKSSGLSNDSIFSHTFDSAGTFNYYCGFHPSMKGTVIVQP